MLPIKCTFLSGNIYFRENREARKVWMLQVPRYRGRRGVTGRDTVTEGLQMFKGTEDRCFCVGVTEKRIGASERE